MHINRRCDMIAGETTILQIIDRISAVAASRLKKSMERHNCLMMMIAHYI